MSKNASLSFVLLLVLVSGCQENKRGSESGEVMEPALCPSCNIVLISIDALRADHLSSYGHVRETSPRIDELARESVLFENPIIAWPKTVPGLASILTGNYGHTTRIMYATFDPMGEENTLISEVLNASGYACGGFVSNGNLVISKGWSQGFEDYVEVWKTINYTRPDNVNRHALDFIKREKDGRFFAWLHYIDPHVPYISREREFRHKFIDDEYYDEIFYDREKKRNVELHHTPPYTWRTFGINGIPQSAIEGNITEVAHYIAEYDAEIGYTDKYVGEVLDYLRENGLWNNTIVVVTADHGEALGDHDWYFDHGRFIYDDQSRVPLIIHVPGIQASRRRHPVSSNDLFPTLLELVGVKKSLQVDGLSLLPVIRGEAGHAAKYVFNEAGYNRDYQRSVRDARWKLIYVPSREARSVMDGGLFELYDLENDRLETKNLAESRPGDLERLKGVLFQWMKNTMPDLTPYTLRDNRSFVYTGDYEFRNMGVSGYNFYAKIPRSLSDLDYCFTLSVPDPDAVITIELLEANKRDTPLKSSQKLWDDPALSESCVGDEWGCLWVNGEKIGDLPYSIRMSKLTSGSSPVHASLIGQENNKTFCFKTGQFNKRAAESGLGYVVEVMGSVESVERDFADVDEETRQTLRRLGYLS